MIEGERREGQFETWRVYLRALDGRNMPAVPLEVARLDYNPRQLPCERAPTAPSVPPGIRAMSDRKYRQRGYQDEPREPRRDQKPAEKKEYAPRGQPPLAPKTFNMPGFREIVRCARCGNELTVATAWSQDATCARCGSDLHACAQCANFDTGALIRVPADHPRARLSQGRPQCLHVLRAPHHRRARDQIAGADQRAKGFRRSVQIANETDLLCSSSNESSVPSVLVQVRMSLRLRDGRCESPFRPWTALHRPILCVTFRSARRSSKRAIRV